MKHEIVPSVFAYVDGIRTNTPKRTKTEIIERAGVLDAKDKASDWAWALTGGAYLLTVWCEGIRVHPENGRWYYVESFTHSKGNGEPLGRLQAPRAAFRVECLRDMYANKKEALAVLQVNATSAQQWSAGADSEVDFRVKDEAKWHVAICDVVRGLLVLVRGNPGWAPGESDIADNAQPASESAPSEPTLVFPDQEHRDLVEAAAVETVTAEYRRRGLRVEDVGHQNLGYDLKVFNGERESYHVEVKGTASPREGFFLTRNERRCSSKLPTWRLAIVTNALSDPYLQIYTAAQMEEAFDFDALVWRCDPSPE
jgi:hypothetical protein